MILTASAVYIVLTPKRFVFETISTVAQEVIIFFIHFIHSYRIDVSSENYIMQVEIALIVFLNLYVIYFFLENVECIVKPKVKKEKKEHSKI